MRRPTLSPWLGYPLQAVFYAAFFAVVGYFSAAPAYTHLPPGEALVKLSVRHAGARKEACHERTPEELAKLAPNMRAAEVCPRERVPIAIRVEMDGAVLFDVVAAPAGLARDGASTVYRRARVAAGKHTFALRMVDTPDPSHASSAERTVTLDAARVLVIDFDPQRGGWVLLNAS